VPPPPADTRISAVSRARPRTDRLAIASFVAGILSLVCAWPFCVGILLGPLAASMGFWSRQRVSSSRGRVAGSGYAVMGLVLGLVGFIVSAAWLVFASNTIANSPHCGSGGPCPYIP
jgi:hypothetical protein